MYRHTAADVHALLGDRLVMSAGGAVRGRRAAGSGGRGVEGEHYSGNKNGMHVHEAFSSQGRTVCLNRRRRKEKVRVFHGGISFLRKLTHHCSAENNVIRAGLKGRFRAEAVLHHFGSLC
ncbi:MAG: hypothetical protein ABFS45_25890 [Pseudomonadota bacterium]